MPGSGPTLVKQASDIATDVEKFSPLNESMTAQMNNVTELKKKNAKILPTIFIGTEKLLILMLVIILG